MCTNVSIGMQDDAIDSVMARGHSGLGAIDATLLPVDTAVDGQQICLWIHTTRKSWPESSRRAFNYRTCDSFIVI